jgi:hypothetical protein
VKNDGKHTGNGHVRAFLKPDTFASVIHLETEISTLGAEIAQRAEVNEVAR